MGGRIADVARRLGKPLMPHQRYIVDVATEIDPETGYFAYNEIIVIGPRQVTGKTELILPVMTWRCAGLDPSIVKWINTNLGINVRFQHPQTALYTAQSADDARKKWRRVHLERLKHSPYKDDFTATLRLNQEMLLWRNGSIWAPVSPTGRASGTGDSVDLAVIDEAWAQQDAHIEVGLRPAMMTRWWRQMWIMSMIPGPSRIDPSKWRYLKQKRQAARAKVEAGVRHGTALFDWAAPDGSDPSNPDTWWSCMPGLGLTVPESTIREDFETMPDLADFEAEYLGIEPKSQRPRWTVISEHLWSSLYDPDSEIASTGARALSVEMNEDRTQAWIGIVGKRWDDNWHCAIAEPGYLIANGPLGIDWVEPRLVDLIEEAKPCTVVIDPRRPAASLIVPLRNRGFDVYTPNQGDIAAACGRFYDRTGANGEELPSLFHLGQPDLNRALAGAKKLDTPGGGFVFVKKGTVAAICPLYTVVLAMLGVDVKGPEMVPEPEIFL